jgi:UDP-N-acetyl-D-mannosaminuronate dehydrogenase
LIKNLKEYWAEVKVHDPYVKSWPEMEDIDIEEKIEDAVAEAEVVVFAVGHDEYKQLEPKELIEKCSCTPLIIDCSNFISDAKIIEYLNLGCQVKGVGKGHIDNLTK